MLEISKTILFSAAVKMLEQETIIDPDGGRPQFCPENLKMIYDKLVFLFSEQAVKES